MGRRHASLWYYLYFSIELVMESLILKYWKKGIGKFEEENVHGKVVIITGSNTGLGKYLATEMAKRGAIVVMGCRNMEKGEIAQKEIIKDSGSQNVELYHLDLSDFSSVKRFVTEVIRRHSVVDMLINNAATFIKSSVLHRTQECWDLTMKTNHLGPFLLTKLLINSISASSFARIVTISSTSCVLSTLDTDDIMMERETNMGILGMKPYVNLKFCNAFFSKCLSKRYSKIKCYSLCPGYVKTELFRNYEGYAFHFLRILLFLIAFEIEEGAKSVLMCCLGRNIGKEESGGFFRFGKRVNGIEGMIRDEVCDEVWKASEKLIKL